MSVVEYYFFTNKYIKTPPFFLLPNDRKTQKFTNESLRYIIYILITSTHSFSATPLCFLSYCRLPVLPQDTPHHQRGTDCHSISWLAALRFVGRLACCKAPLSLAVCLPPADARQAHQPCTNSAPSVSRGRTCVLCLA